MSDESNDLIRVAELIKLAALTARAFNVVCDDPHLLDVAKRISDAAEELATIGRKLDRSNPGSNIASN